MGLLPIYVLCLPSVLVLSSVHCYEWAKQMKFLLVVNIGRLNDIQTALKLGFWNFDTLFIQVKYQNMGSISLIVWKLCPFRQRSNFGNFHQFIFFISFNWNRNFEFWWFHRKDLVPIYQNISYFKLIWYFLDIKINF